MFLYYLLKNSRSKSFGLCLKIVFNTYVRCCLGYVLFDFALSDRKNSSRKDAMIQKTMKSLSKDLKELLAEADLSDKLVNIEEIYPKSYCRE